MHLPDANPLPTFLPRPLANRSLPRQQHNVQPAKKSPRYQTYSRPTPLRHSLPLDEPQGQLLRLGVGYFLRDHLGAIAVCVRTST